jgi:hypothetical protein
MDRLGNPVEDQSHADSGYEKADDARGRVESACADATDDPVGSGQ